MGMRPVPNNAPITQEYGANPSAINGPNGHSGRDYAVVVGTDVVSLTEGVVRWADWCNNLPGGPYGWAARWFLSLTFGGIVTVIEHDDCFSITAHLDRTDLNIGDRVFKGQVIAKSGATGLGTGPHAHTEILPKPVDYSRGSYGRVNPGPYHLEPYAPNRGGRPAPAPAPRANYRLEEHRTSPNQSGRRPGKITGVTIHWWNEPSAGATFDGTVNHLCNPGSGVSAHFVVEAGRVSCLVSPGNIAWHAGNWDGNLQTIGIECNPRMSAADLETVAQLVATLEQQYGDLKVFRHSDWTSTRCPGTYAKKIGWIVDRVNALRSGQGTATTQQDNDDVLEELLTMDQKQFDREKKIPGRPAWYLVNGRDHSWRGRVAADATLALVKTAVELLKGSPRSVWLYRNPAAEPKRDAYAVIRETDQKVDKLAAQVAELSAKLDGMGGN